LFNVAFGVLFFGLLRDLVQSSLRSEYDSYIPFIPFISAYLIYGDRQAIFSQKGFSYTAGLLIMGIGILLLFVGRNREALFDHRDHLALITFSLVVLWIGGFTLCYGLGSLRAAAFPLLFLFFAVPIPGAALERTIIVLQTGSAEVAYWFLKATGMPIARDGFVFHLSKLDVEVAPQCSGIRSSLSLVITGVLAAYLFLRTSWARILLMLTIVPIAILKNGIRIATLATLSVYWDEKILASDLHHKGGVVFFILALLMVGAVIMLLRKMETRKKVTEDVK
jgi:exosortase